MEDWDYCPESQGAATQFKNWYNQQSRNWKWKLRKSKRVIWRTLT